jgi:hypothetical protein
VAARVAAKVVVGVAALRAAARVVVARVVARVVASVQAAAADVDQVPTESTGLRLPCKAAVEPAVAWPKHRTHRIG